VRWRGDKRVDVKLNGSVSADVFQRLGYIEDQVDGWFQVDGSVGWKPGVWGFRGQARASRLRALDWELSGVEASIVGDRNAVWADVDRARYGGGGVTGWVEVSLPKHDGRQEDVRRTRMQLRLEGIDAEKFLDDSRIPVGDLAARIGGTLDYHFAETDWRHGAGVADMRVTGDSRQGHGLAMAGAVPLVIERGVVSTQGVRLVGPGQEVTAAARYELPSESGSIDYHVQSTDLGPLAEALPVSPAADGGSPLWLPTKGAGEISGTLLLAPKHTSTDLHLALTDAVARGIAADRATGVVTLSGDAVEAMRLELAKGSGAAIIAGRVEYARARRGTSTSTSPAGRCRTRSRGWSSTCRRPGRSPAASHWAAPASRAAARSPARWRRARCSTSPSTACARACTGTTRRSTSSSSRRWRPPARRRSRAPWRSPATSCR